MMPGGILDVDNSPRASPRVESHCDRGPSGSENYYSAPLMSGAPVIDYGGGVGEVPAVRQMESNERFRAMSNQGSGGDVRAARQMEISERIRAAQREMDQLTAAQNSQPASGRAPTPAPSQQEMVSLRNQVQELKNKIEQMQNQQQSDWALGLSDEPPPAYE